MTVALHRPGNRQPSDIHRPRPLPCRPGLAAATCSGVVVAAGAVAYVGSGSSPIAPSLDAPGPKAVVTVTVGMALLCAAYVSGLRVRRRRRVGEFIDTAALTLLGVLGVAHGAVMLELLQQVDSGSQVFTLRLAASVCGALALLAAALWADRPLRARHATARTALLLAAVCAAAVLLAKLGVLLWDLVPGLLDVADGTVIVRAGYAVVTASLVASAAIRFTRGSATRDVLGCHLTAALLCGAAGTFQYALHERVELQTLHLGELLYLLGACILATGAARGWIVELRAQADAQAARQRAELARTLHDGIAQDLALVAAQSRWLARRAGGSDPADLQLVATAAQRALDESREAIHHLRT